MKKSVLAAMTAATAFALPSAVQAQGLTGDQISCNVTSSAVLACDASTAIVGPGREFNITFSDSNLFGINFLDNELRINALASFAVGSGNVFLDFRDLTDPFTSFSLLEAGFVGFTASDVSLNGAGRLRIDVGGTTGIQGSQVRLGLTGGTAVPEPGTWGMLLVGFGAVGYSLRRVSRRRPLATV